MWQNLNEIMRLLIEPRQYVLHEFGWMIELFWRRKKKLAVRFYTLARKLMFENAAKSFVMLSIEEKKY